MKVKRFMAFFMAIILAFSCAWNLSVNVKAEETEKSRIHGLRREDLDYTWVFTNEDLEISLDTEGVDPDGFSVEWTVGTMSENGEISAFNLSGKDVTEGELYTATNNGITFHGAGLAKITNLMRVSKYGEENVFDVLVKVIDAGDQVLYEKWFNGVLTEPEYNYEFPCSWPGDNQMLVGENLWIDAKMGVNYRDYNAPYGEWTETTITDVTLEQYTWNDKGEDVTPDHDIFEVNKDENAWNIRGVDHGWAKVTITYDTLDGDKRLDENAEEESYVNTATYSFDIYSIGQYYRLDLSYPNATSNMLQNSTNTVDTTVVRRYLDENDNHCEEIVKDYELYLSQYKDEETDEMKDAYDSDLISIEVDDKAFTITSNDNCWGTGTYVYALIPNGEDEEGNQTYEEAGSVLEVYVSEEFTNIEPAYLKNVLLGETFDLASMSDTKKQPNYYRYYKNEQGENDKELITMDNKTIRMRMEYNEDVFEATEETKKDLMPVLVRKSQDGGHVRLIVEEYSEEDNEWHEVNSRHYNMDGLDYSIWLTDLQDGGHGWIYTNQEEQVYHIDTCNLDDKDGYEVNFELGRWVEMEEHEDGGEYVPYTSDKYSTQEGWLFDYVKTDGKVTGIKLNVAAIGELQNMEEGQTWSEMKLFVCVGNQIVHEENNGLEYRFGGYEYHLPEEEWILPYWGYGIDKCLEGRKYGTEYDPDGEDFTTTITDVSINVIEGDKYDFTINEWKDGNGWNIDAEGYGRAEVTLTYVDATDTDKTLTHTFILGVGGDVWEMDDLSSDNGTEQMIPGGSMTLQTAVRIKKYDEEKGHYTEIPNVEYVWEVQENDIVELTPHKDNPGKCDVVAKTDVPNDSGTRIVCTAYLLDEEGNRQVDENGNEIIFGERDFWLSVYDEMYYINFQGTDHLEVGQCTDIIPRLYHTNSSEAIEGAEFELDWDPNAICVMRDNQEIDHENGRATLEEGETYTIKRIGDWQTHLNMWAYLKNENGDREEVAYRGRRYAELNYDISYEDLRCGGHTRVFYSEESYSISLNTANIADDSTENGLRKDLSIQWRLGYGNEEGGFDAIDIPEGILTVGEGKDCNTVTVNGTLLKDVEEVKANHGIHIQAAVMFDEEMLRENTTWLEVRDTEEYVSDDESDVLIGAAWRYENNTINYYITDADHPNGAEYEATIHDITCSNKDDSVEDPVLEAVKDGDTWIINALTGGEAYVTFTISYEENGKTVTKDVKSTRYVADETYRFSVYPETNTEHMVPGQTMTLRKELLKGTYNTEEGKRTWNPIPESEYEVCYEDYDKNVIEIDDNGVLTAVGVGETSIRVIASYGEQERDTYITVYVVKGYDKMISDVVYVQPGDSFTLETTKARFVTYDRGDLEGTEVDADSVVLAEQELDGCFKVDAYGKITVDADFEAEDWPYQTGFEVKGTLNENEHGHWCTVVICKHSWKDSKVIKAATCTKSGIKELICEHCDTTRTEEIPAKGHTEVVIPAVAATETSTGLTQGKKCSVCGTILEKQEVVAKLQPAHKCSYTYVSNNDATVLADGTRIGTCECGKTTGVVTDPGTKLNATIKVPAKSFKMQTKQTYKGFAVTMGKGDYIVSVKSNKTNIVKVSGINKTKGTFTIKAQKKTGKAVVTIKLASGKSQKITITVQKKAVKTTKISGLASKITLVKGKKTTLKPVITPITSKQKVKFKTSNKKVVTVSAKGVVLAKKKGKAKITVTSGSKKKTITVTVKNK